jgi:F-type H+-transporting ATPase subunit b
VIDWFTVVVQVINFLILVVLLRIFLYRRVLAVIDARERRISEGLALTRQARAEYDAARCEHERMQAEASILRSERLAELEREVAAGRERLVAAARAEVAELRRRWQAALDREQDDLLQALRRRIASQAVAVARQALGDVAAADLEQAAITAFCQRLSTVAGPAPGTPPRLITAAPLSPSAHAQVESAVLAWCGQAPTVSTDPALVCGVVLEAGTVRVAWSIEQYMAAVDDEIVAALSGSQAA